MDRGWKDSTVTDDTQKTIEDYHREADERESAQQALLDTLVIPETPEREGHTYTRRTLKADRVAQLDKYESGSYAVTGEDGWGASIPAEAAEQLKVGDPFILETIGFNEIGGWIVNGQWYGHLSDQEVEARRDESLRKRREEFLAYVEAHRAEWIEREAALPDWAKKVMAKNRESEEFETDYMGWGYVLIALELAVLYAKDESVKDLDSMRGYEESEELKEFHRENGTSGNQAGWAFAIARAHLRGEI